MTIGLLMTLLCLLQVKHLICDFFLQFPRHYLNKGTYGKYGGIEHSLIHVIGTLVCLQFVGVIYLYVCLVILVVEFIIHYHVDWAKMNINRIMNWKPDTHDQFWLLLGVDQFLHQATYIWILWFLI